MVASISDNSINNYDTNYYNYYKLGGGGGLF